MNLVPLSDGRPGLRTTTPVQVHDPGIAYSLSPSHGERAGERGPDKTNAGGTGSPPPSDGRGARGEGQTPSDHQPVLDFISSDETLDRFDEIITASGWKLSSYARNPVFQNAHQYGDIIFTLGRALVTEVRGGKLFQRVQFATDVNPMAKIAHGLYRGKFLSAVSVGFIPLRWEDGTQGTPYRRKYLEQELLEVSAVAIPANPNALALGLKSGAVEKSDLRDLADLIRLTLEPRSPWSAPAERSGDGALVSPPPTKYRDLLLPFLKQLHSILRS